MHVTALILAAGKGLRFKSSVPKPLVVLNRRPFLAYSLAVFGAHPQISDIVVTASADALERVRRCVAAAGVRKSVRVVEGGRRRQDSVYNGLRALDGACDAVLIHDSARPFVDAGIVSRVIAGVACHGACICGVRVKGTIKKVKCKHPARSDGPVCACVQGQKEKGGKPAGGERLFVRETMKRDELWEMQTPQGFGKALILKAFEKYGAAEVTDDASLVEKLKHPVAVVEGSYYNIKVTTPEDFVFAKAVAARRA